MHPHLDRARVAPEDFPDLGVSQALKPAQQQDFALFDRQPRERALEQSDLLRLPRLPVGRVTIRFNRLFGFPRDHPLFPLPLSQGVEMGVAGRLKHPGAELVLRLERVPIFKHAKKDFLHEVFAELAPAGQADEEAEKRLVMPFEQHPELFHLALPDLGHQLIVRE